MGQCRLLRAGSTKPGCIRLTCRKADSFHRLNPPFIPLAAWSYRVVCGTKHGLLPLSPPQTSEATLPAARNPGSSPPGPGEVGAHRQILGGQLQRDRHGTKKQAPRFHRITEWQGGWKGPLEIIQSNPRAGCTGPCPGVGFEYLQRRTLHNPSG